MILGTENDRQIKNLHLFMRSPFMIDAQMRKLSAPNQCLVPPMSLAHSGMPILHFGSRGSSVRLLQKMLNRAGARRRLPETEYFGELTKAAVVHFQMERRLQPVDGIVGPKTWASLERISGVALSSSNKTPPSSGRQSSSNSDASSHGNTGLDIQAAVEHLRNYAEPGSIGSCAKYVRQALEAGGMNTDGRPIAATDYGPFLRKKGFIEVPKEGYQPAAGDIIVLKAITGHIYGHITMFDGTQWISDFKQRDFWGGPGLRNKTEYTIFRP